jgi:hypothetical protein
MRMRTTHCANSFGLNCEMIYGGIYPFSKINSGATANISNMAVFSSNNPQPQLLFGIDPS